MIRFKESFARRAGGAQGTGPCADGGTTPGRPAASQSGGADGLAALLGRLAAGHFLAYPRSTV